MNQFKIVLFYYNMINILWITIMVIGEKMDTYTRILQRIVKIIGDRNSNAPERLSLVDHNLGSDDVSI